MRKEANMKKAFFIVLPFVTLFFLVSGCASGAKESPPANIRIGGLTGPTTMGMVRLMETAENGAAANSYTFTIAGSADELTPKIIQGELDIAAVPINLAAVLYNNTGGAVSMLAVNTLGVLYITETGEKINTLRDLKGKTIYATGKGTVPEYVLRYLLAENGIDPDRDIDIEWKTEPAEIIAHLSGQENAIAMMPQPYVTIAQTQIDTLRTVIDLTEEWNKLDNGSSLITGVLIVHNEFAEQYPEQLDAFLKEYKQSTQFVNSNTEQAAQLIEEFGIFNATVAEKAIPYCNITYLDGKEMKKAAEGYLGILFEHNPKSVGGSLPGEGFYYGG
jgi:NitT/TauT family transport system substrate-binding protein